MSSQHHLRAVFYHTIQDPQTLTDVFSCRTRCSSPIVRQLKRLWYLNLYIYIYIYMYCLTRDILYFLWVIYFRVGPRTPNRCSILSSSNRITRIWKYAIANVHGYSSRAFWSLNYQCLNFCFFSDVRVPRRIWPMMNWRKSNLFDSFTGMLSICTRHRVRTTFQGQFWDTDLSVSLSSRWWLVGLDGRTDSSVICVRM